MKRVTKNADASTQGKRDQVRISISCTPREGSGYFQAAVLSQYSWRELCSPFSCLENRQLHLPCRTAPCHNALLKMRPCAIPVRSFHIVCTLHCCRMSPLNDRRRFALVTPDQKQKLAPSRGGIKAQECTTATDILRSKCSREETSIGGCAHEFGCDFYISVVHH